MQKEIGEKLRVILGALRRGLYTARGKGVDCPSSTKANHHLGSISMCRMCTALGHVLSCHPRNYSRLRHPTKF